MLYFARACFGLECETGIAFTPTLQADTGVPASAFTDPTAFESVRRRAIEARIEVLAWASSGPGRHAKGVICGIGDAEPY